MPRYSFLAFTAFFIFSCHHPTGIKEVISKSDSATLSSYKGDGSMDSVLKVVILRDRKKIDQLAGFIESAPSKEFKCGYDGVLHFFKNNSISNHVYFRMNEEGCMHFSFILNGKVYNTKLSDEAKKFISGLN